MGLPDTIIPEEKLPQCWSDEVRMNALFAPFRLKSANPESWDMKMKFWSEMLRIWCKCKNDPLVSASDAKVAFQRKGRTPACIEIVVEEMFRNGELSPISKYQQMLHNGPESWVRWGTRLAFRPAAFALTAVASLLPARQATDSDGLPKASVDATMRFVLESAVKEQSLDLLSSYPPGAERIGTIEELMRNCQWNSSRDTFEVLLGYLVAQGHAVKKGDVVKLAEPNKKASPVTEADEAAVKLLSAEARLSRDAARLSRDVAAAEADAKAALQLGNRVAAKNHLRRKHQLSARLVKCDAALENVRQLMQHVKDVDVNSEIVDTYRTTSQAIRRNLTEGGLNEDDVHNTMDDLRDVMDSINEVEKALAGPGEELDAAELEQELKELLGAPSAPGGGTRERIPVAPAVSTLPSPPRDLPSRPLRSDREFVFDGEERVLAELNELGSDDTPATRVKARAAADGGGGVKSPESKPRASQSWYPPSQQCLRPQEVWNNNTEPSYGEVRLDDRLHPGQRLNVDFTSPPRLYSTDFIVPDHRMADGVWLYNSKDTNSNITTSTSKQSNNSRIAAAKDVQSDNSHIPSGLRNMSSSNSTEYVSTESPGKSGGSFQMAPGGERKNSNAWHAEESPIDDLEARLRNLRGFRL